MNLELRGTLTLAHLTATMGGVRKQGGIKLIRKILNILTDLSKKKRGQGDFWF